MTKRFPYIRLRWVLLAALVSFIAGWVQACMSDVANEDGSFDVQGEIAPEDVGLAAEAVTMSSANNTNVSPVFSTDYKLIMAMCGAMQYPTGYYGCSLGASSATCNLAFGSGPTPISVGNCINVSNSEAAHNPPGGTMLMEKDCLASGGGYAIGLLGAIGGQKYVKFNRSGTNRLMCKPNASGASPGTPVVWYNY